MLRARKVVQFLLNGFYGICEDNENVNREREGKAAKKEIRAVRRRKIARSLVPFLHDPVSNNKRHCKAPGQMSMTQLFFFSFELESHFISMRELRNNRRRPSGVRIQRRIDVTWTNVDHHNLEMWWKHTQTKCELLTIFIVNASAVNELINLAKTCRPCQLNFHHWVRHEVLCFHVI